MTVEVGHDALGEAVHLFEGGGFGHAHAGDADVDFFEAGVVVLYFEEFFGYEVGWASEEAAAFDVAFDGWEVGGEELGGVVGVDGGDLGVRETADEAEGAEHLDAFFGPEFGLRDGLFGGVGDVHGVRDDEIAAEFEVAPVIGLDFLPLLDDLVGCSAGCCASSDDAFDAVFGHEIEAALGCGHDGLPPLDGVFRSWYEGDFFEFVSSVGDPWRDFVMLTVVRKGAFVEGLVHDLNLFFEEFAVGVLVDDWVAEGFDFSGVVSAADSEADAAVCEDVGGGVVFGKAKGVPHGVDVESAAESEVFGEVSEVDEEHQEVGNALVSFALEVVFGAPEGIKTQFVHGFCERFRFVEDGR